jgi:hypothetical protein
VKESQSPCRAGATAQPATRLTFFRRQRARAGRRSVLRLRASRSATATVEVGGTRRPVRLRAGLNRVRLPKLDRGRYALTVTAGGTTRRATLVVR